MHKLTIIMKVTNECNIKCRHCYNSEKTSCNKFMPIAVIKKVFGMVEPDKYDRIQFIWHGGEPLLFSLEKFKEMYVLQNEVFGKYTSKITNSVQTNGLLLTSEYEDFFCENKFGVGISYDGICNDILRQGTKQLVPIIKHLKERKFAFGILSTICSESVYSLKELYSAFKVENLDWKFNCIFPSGRAKNEPALIVEPEIFISNLTDLLKTYFFDRNGTIRVYYLDVFLNMILKNRRHSCVYSSCLYKYVSIDPDGNMYPCGRYYPEEYNLGNVYYYDNFGQVFNSGQYEQIVNGAIIRREKCKNECAYYKYCQGGCNNSFILEGNIESNQSESCIILKRMIDAVQEILFSIKQEDMDQINPILRDDVLNYLIHRDTN